MTVVYLDQQQGDFAQVIAELQRLHRERKLDGLVVTYWTEKSMKFTAVGELTTEHAVMEAVGCMEHHKSWLLSAYNAALIATAQELASEYDGKARTDTGPGDGSPREPA